MGNKTVVVLTLEVDTDNSDRVEEVLNNFRANLGEHFTEVDILDQIVSSASEFQNRMAEADDLIRKIEAYEAM